MQTVKSSVPYAAADRWPVAAAARWPVAAAARFPVAAATRLVVTAGLLALQAAGLNAQPVLRVDGDAGATVTGTMINGTATYPARALEVLGFTLESAAGSLTAVLGPDTLRFWATSPFFRAQGSVHQLAFPITHVGGVTQLPEQFFIRWLPAAYPDRFQFRGGALQVTSGTLAGATGTVAPPVDPVVAERAAARRAVARERVVVIDPGHGGRDPGSIGPNGLREKDVTLLISQRLAAVLRDRGYEVHLTRTTDTLIALGDRPKLANRWRGERPVAVFLSIHTNAARSSSARGFETFFLAEAQTEDERRVAEMENEAVRFEDTPSSPAGNGLDQILSNLRSDFLMRASHDLAAVMQEKMAAFHPGPNRGVKRGGLIVLIGSIMPAVLIETGFISNRDESSMLGTQSFQQTMAWGIADAVDEFFRRNEHLWVHDP
jgi:N-acetylmuramoyl-L-alanine amidase